MAAHLISELAYEELLAPQPGEGPDAYRLTTDSGRTVTFRARRSAYGHWRVDADPATLMIDGAPLADPVGLLADLRRTLGLDGATTAHLVRDLLATLTADARLDGAARAAGDTAARLADLDYAALEGRQTGHPWIVANKGRLGFSAADAQRHAPEHAEPRPLPWIAVHRDLARYRAVPRLADPERLYGLELDPAARARLEAAVHARGRAPEEYLLLPVHPWQWESTLAPLYAPQLAEGLIIPLPSDGDLRLPQQSIRTFLNASRPQRHSVKLPLSVLNTLVWRGLPTERTLAAPAVTAWIHALRDADPFLRDECRVILLGEVASIAVPHPLYESEPLAAEVPYQYRELLGCIWREPLAPRLEPGERARTLAALLRTGTDGRALTAELVARSGLSPEEWTRLLLHALLPPLLHFLYRYGLVFSPHGENAIVVFDTRGVPVRLAVKDFVDDVNLGDTGEPLPEQRGIPAEAAAVLLREPPAFLCQFIHSGLFVGVFRYLAPLMEEQLGLRAEAFWGLVRAEILDHQARFPELAPRFRLFDLLTPRIDRLCLNRNRLLMDGYRDRADRPHAAVHGTVPNPLVGATGVTGTA
nr:IucA/IucC family siderophore biosynthesis protein [Mangrovactinospora gilvigrisea]